MLTRIANRMKKQQKGFTLIELLLVVAILAVLAFLAIPAIAQTIRNARIRTCLSNETMVETNLWRWYADQVAAGKTFTIADPEGAVALDAFAGRFTEAEGSAELDDPVDYFTPNQFPTCPFDADNDYEVTYTVSTDGTALESISCDCAGNPH